MSLIPARASPIRRWPARIGATLLTAVLATPLAGAIGGSVLYLALRMEQPEASAMLWLAFVFYGALFGSLLAWPVTLLFLPACTLLLHARRTLSRALLPLAGLLAGTWRLIGEFPDMLSIDASRGFPDAHHVMAIAGAAGGLCAGLLCAWIPPALCPHAFSSRYGAPPCVTSP